MHGADESSAEVLSYLLRRLSDIPFLVLQVVVALEEALARAVIVETDELQRPSSGLALLNHRARCARPSLPARHELDRRRVDLLGVR